MEKPKLLIADGTEEFRMVLADALSGLYRIRTCVEGNQALEQLRAFSPDILVLDLMLPGLDGISVLQMSAAFGAHPVVLAVTRFVNDYVMESLDRLAVEYVMVKPCNVRAVADRLADLVNRIPQPAASAPDPRTTVSNLLLSFGIPTKLRGYTYLREAILLMASNPSQMVTKHLYPAVAEICGCEDTHVERCIRSALISAWENRDEQLWSMYFPRTADGLLLKPTNAAFISRLADSLLLQEKPNVHKNLKESV